MAITPLRLSAVLIGLLLGCGQSDQAETHKEDCYVTQHGQRLFVGSRSCMWALPRHRMSGVWVTGNEYSVFYPGASTVPPPDAQPEVWLDIDGSVASKVRLSEGPPDRVFRIDFLGTRSDEPGIHGGLASNLKRGVWVMRIISIEELERPKIR